MPAIDGIINEQDTNFVGKDGFVWWVGEVEDNEDPMELGRVKVRCLGYYTNFAGGTLADLPTENLPWATVLQHTSQPGNDGQGESAGQLQPGAIVLGFFMDGEMAQMPIVLGVMRVNKSAQTRTTGRLAFSNSIPEPGVVINNSSVHPAEKNTINPVRVVRQSINNTVAYPGQTKTISGSTGSPKNIGIDFPGGSSNPIRPLDPEKPIPVANGIGGPWKTLEYKLSYLLEDLVNTSASLVKAEGGEYLDLTTGKLITKKELTRAIRDYVTTIYAQVISNIRQSLISLSEDLKLVELMLATSGKPFAMYTTVTTGVTKILGQACKVDSNLNAYVSAVMKTVDNSIDSYLSGCKTKQELVVDGVNTITANIATDVKKIVKDIGDLTTDIKTNVNKIDNDELLLKEWEKGLTIFEQLTTLFNNGQYGFVSLTPIFKLLASVGEGCKREPEGTKKTTGWYPLFGITDSDRLKSLEKVRGSATKGTDLFSSVFRDSDPYLSTASNHINGSYDLRLGTPGRLADVTKRCNGTTHTSLVLNNSHFAEKVARDTFKKENPDATLEQIEDAVEKFRMKTTANKGDTGSLVADHVTYAGTLTQEVHGDDCKLVTGHQAVVVDGDYFLKITGDCHLEVGGGFFLTAEGSPKASGKIQRHALKFGSDVDMSVVGAKFHFQSSELDLSATRTRMTGNFFENTNDVQVMSGLELTMQAQSSIQVIAPHLLELIGVEEDKYSKKIRGKRSVTVGGNYEHHFHSGQTSLYKEFRVNLTNTKALYNDTLNDGELRQFIGGTSLSTETTSP
jgi:hypothetical protein